MERSKKRESTVAAADWSVLPKGNNTHTYTTDSTDSHQERKHTPYTVLEQAGT